MRRAVVLGALLLLLAQRAHAQPEPEAPNRQELELYESGRKAFNLGEFAAAIEQWRAGYALVAKPYFLYDIAQAYRQLHDDEKAIFFYRSYLREAPAAANAEVVRGRLAELEALLAHSQRPPTGPLPPVSARAADPPLVVAAAREPERSRRPRWPWLGAGGLALGGGIALDLIPHSAHDHAFGALDLLPVALYAGAAVAVYAGLR